MPDASAMASGVPDESRDVSVASCQVRPYACDMNLDEWAKQAVAALLQRCAKAIGSEAELMVRRAAQ